MSKNTTEDKTMENQNTVMMLEAISQHRKSIITTINQLVERNQKAPDGTLRIAKKRNGYQYYQRTEVNDTIGKYLTANDKTTAAALAQKDYDTKLIKALEEQLSVIDRFISDFDPDKPVQVYKDLSCPRKTLLTPVFMTDEEFVKQWQNAPYEKLGFKKDDPEFYTARGERVRSKSEILIADSLFRHNIPYRYEYPLYHDGVLIAAPDFNCLNVRTRREYYWEHLGMMGQENYANRNVKKINKYTLNEMFDEKSLIITMETDNAPLNTRVIEEKIRKYLL